MSKLDIAKGKPWFASISEQLARTRVCLTCITQENAKSPWLYYEAGAIANAPGEVLICTYLIGVGHDAIGCTPFGQYQSTLFEKDDTWQLIRDINNALSNPHSEDL